MHTFIKGSLTSFTGPGSAFGEIALVNKESFRNATIITDEPADLMVIDQELFDRSLRVGQKTYNINLLINIERRIRSLFMIP